MATYVTREMLIDALTKFAESGDKRWALKEEVETATSEVVASLEEYAKKSETVTDDRVAELVDYAAERIASNSDSRYALKSEAVSEDRVRQIVDEMSNEFHSATMYFGNSVSPKLKKVDIGVIEPKDGD